MQKIVLESFARIGDVVVMMMDKEVRDWVGSKELPDGTLGTVIGFYRYKVVVERNRCRKDRIHGVYECNGVPIVKWENGKTGKISPHYIAIDDVLLEERRKDTKYKEAFETPHYISPLPSLPFCEHDIVELNEPIFGNSTMAKICRIDYLNVGEFCDDGVTPYPIYTIRPCDASGPTTSIRESDIRKLCKRGLYWQWEHDKENMVFENIRQEVEFYVSIGYGVEMRNPKNNLYSWNIEEAEQAIKDETIASISVVNGFFGNGPSIVCYTFPDLPDFEKRLRTEYQFQSA